MKLDAEQQKAVAEAEEKQGDGEFEALPEGYYLAKVDSIKMSQKAGTTGYKQWVVVWKIVKPAASRNRTVWDRISLSPQAAWKMREFFDALGFTYDSDSDELVGETAIIELSQEEITSGQKKGQMSNNVERVMDAEDADNQRLVAK